MTHRRGETSRQEGEGGENDGGARQDSTGGGWLGGGVYCHERDLVSWGFSSGRILRPTGKEG
jgi:hypothetical protein